MWFNQAFSGPDDLASGVDTLILSVDNAVELSLPDSALKAANDIELIAVKPMESVTLPPILLASEGDMPCNVTSLSVLLASEGD